MNNNEQSAISISNVLTNDKYIIPIYQRNYEWEKEQISRLVSDINGISENESYYLGTLVTFKDKEGKYELIDGQQRHTTLNLLKGFIEEKDLTFNIEFQARPECDKFFNSLKNGFESLYENERSKNLENGLKIIQDVFQENNIHKTDFRKKLLEQTFIFRTELPEDTDLNHYFEIMNNRGEQLEKHEILKAQLMEIFEDDETKSQTFSEIWDACAYMGDYIWNNFEKNIAVELFKNPEELLSKCNFTFQDLTTILKNEEKSEKNSLKSILADKTPLPSNFTQENQEKTDKYRSILDFPSFLIYVFNCICPKESTSFDDKKLLDIFKDYNDSESYLVALLKTRIYFDQYFIKNDLASLNDTKWGIRSFTIENNELKNNESTFENSKTEDKIEMLQAMFYYTTISNDKKDWLIAVLNEKPTSETLLFNNLFRSLKSIIGDIQIENLNYKQFSSKTFYYFEYMLWDIYKNYIQGEKDNFKITDLQTLIIKISKNKSLFNDFRFRQLNSIEHLFPQSYSGLPIKDKHRFGNLCLISSSQNSQGNKESVANKKSRYKNDSSSLKRVIMFNSFENEVWGEEQILRHESEIKKLLEYFKNKIT